VCCARRLGWPSTTSPVLRGISPDVYVAAGRFDQWIFVAPRFDLVVVVTGGTDQTFAEPVDFLYDAILPAMR
jgi:CubicO group peptidase (beta-lactamase class C family)